MGNKLEHLGSCKVQLWRKKPERVWGCWLGLWCIGENSQTQWSCKRLLDCCNFYLFIYLSILFLLRNIILQVSCLCRGLLLHGRYVEFSNLFCFPLSERIGNSYAICWSHTHTLCELPSLKQEGYYSFKKKKKSWNKHRDRCFLFCSKFSYCESNLNFTSKPR